MSGSPTPDPDGVSRYTGTEPLDAVVDDPSAGGTYVLVFRVTTPVRLDVGALGRVDVPAGEYAYVGSALGPGGFTRVERHRRQLDGTADTVHWHIDALTTSDETEFVAAWLSPAVDVECAVASRLPPGPVDGFGASDCRCRTHLSRVDRHAVAEVVRAAVETHGSAV